MNKVVLPIYYTQTFKTKKDKTFMVGMNWYRQTKNHFLLNDVKKYYTDLVERQSIDLKKIEGQYTLQIDVYYKNPSSDGSNIASMMEKFSLDALQKCGIVIEDNSKYHIGTTWSLKEKDKENPRVEITIKEI